MSTSRKDYVKAIDLLEIEFRTPTKAASPEAAESTITVLCNLFGQDNPRLDRSRFRAEAEERIRTAHIPRVGEEVRMYAPQHEGGFFAFGKCVAVHMGTKDGKEKKVRLMAWEGEPGALPSTIPVTELASKDSPVIEVEWTRKSDGAKVHDVYKWRGEWCDVVEYGNKVERMISIQRAL